jgi:Effector Associated Constant Component 1
MDEAVELRLEPVSERFDAVDDRWLDQVAGLVSELQDGVGGVSRRREPVEGTKGALDSILLSLTSAGALTAAVELIKAWLTRDRSRSVKVTWAADGSVQQFELAGSEIDPAAFDQIVRAVSRQLPTTP